MHNRYFYHSLLKKYIVTFGSLFNNIYILRYKTDGTEVKRERVPIAFSPREKFFARLGEDLDMEKRNAALSKYPRLGYELESVEYAPQRKTGAMRKSCVHHDTGQTFMYASVPYTLSFALNVWCKGLDEVYQIVEQIIPFFTPDYNVTIKPIDGQDLELNIPFVLTSIVGSDTYEGGLEEDREILWTLSFTAAVDFYGPIRDGKLIYGTTTSINDQDTEANISTTEGTPSQVGAATPADIDFDQEWKFLTSTSYYNND